MGPALFGALIGYLGGQYWGGFLFLAILNVVGAAGYVALHRVSTTLPLVPARPGWDKKRSHIAVR
jgi:hypothetical protein